MRCLGDGCSVVAAIAENLDKCRNSHVTVDKPMRSFCKRIEVRRRSERVTVPATGVQRLVDKPIFAR